MTSGIRQAVFFVLLLGVAAAGYQYMVKPANQHLSEAKQRVDGKLAKLTEFEEATAKAIIALGKGFCEAKRAP